MRLHPFGVEQYPPRVEDKREETYCLGLVKDDEN